MKLHYISLLSLAGLAPFAGYAASVTYNTPLTTLNNNNDTVLNLSLFDTAFGALTGVRISYSLTLSGVSVQMDNDSADANTGTAKVLNVVNSFSSSLKASSLFDSNDDSIIDASKLVVNVGQDFSLLATSGDAVGAFNATGQGDAASWAPGTITRGGSGDVGESYIVKYAKLGGGTFALTSNNSYLTSATFSGPSGYFQGNTPTANVSASVTYTYTPTAIPEPSTYAVLLGFVILGGTMYVRRRKQN